MSSHRIPPGPSGYPLIGSLIPFLRNPLALFMQCAREYGDVVRLRFPGTEVYLLHHPEHIEYVLRGEPKNFIKDDLTRRLSNLVGHGLLTSEGEFWRQQRRAAQPAFQPSHIHHYGTVMTTYTERMLESWQAGQQRDVHRDMMRLTLEIAAKTLFDSDISAEANEVRTALEAVMAYDMGLSMWLLPDRWSPTPAAFRFRRAVRTLDQIIYRIIEQHRTRDHESTDLLSRLLAVRYEDGTHMSNQQLRDEVMTLLLAGHETTALTLFYCCYLLAQHPQTEQALTDEWALVLGDRTPTAADVPHLRYTTWVVRESMRLYPPAWGIGREAVKDCTIGEYHVPKGTQLYLNQWVVHRDPRWFDDPEVFKPERWDNDLVKRLPHGAYFPFGDGPRICIGNHFAMMEAVLVLATIGQRYHMTLLSDRPLALIPSVTLRPKHGVKMIVHKRPRHEGATLGPQAA
jgi:cytochrome P450